MRLLASLLFKTGNKEVLFYEHKKEKCNKTNLRGMMRILGGDPAGKVGLLLECAGPVRDIADPWYTGDFDRAYADIVAGCDGLIQMLKEGKRK